MQRGNLHGKKDTRKTRVSLSPVPVMTRLPGSKPSRALCPVPCASHRGIPRAPRPRASISHKKEHVHEGLSRNTVAWGLGGGQAAGGRAPGRYPHLPSPDRPPPLPGDQSGPFLAEEDPPANGRRRGRRSRSQGNGQGGYVVRRAPLQARLHQRIARARQVFARHLRGGTS